MDVVEYMDVNKPDTPSRDPRVDVVDDVVVAPTKRNKRAQHTLSIDPIMDLVECVEDVDVVEYVDENI